MASNERKASGPCLTPLQGPCREVGLPAQPAWPWGWEQPGSKVTATAGPCSVIGGGGRATAVRPRQSGGRSDSLGTAAQAWQPTGGRHGRGGPGPGTLRPDAAGPAKSVGAELEDGRRRAEGRRGSRGWECARPGVHQAGSRATSWPRCPQALTATASRLLVSDPVGG